MKQLEKVLKYFKKVEEEHGVKFSGAKVREIVDHVNLSKYIHDDKMWRQAIKLTRGTRVLQISYVIFISSCISPRNFFIRHTEPMKRTSSSFLATWNLNTSFSLDYVMVPLCLRAAYMNINKSKWIWSFNSKLLYFEDTALLKDLKNVQKVRSS